MKWSQRLVLSNRWDSKGFRFHGKPVLSVSFHWWKLWKSWPCFLFRLDLGRGAGCRWGRTFFVGVNVKGGGQRWMYARARFRIGLTQNANVVPYGFGG